MPRCWRKAEATPPRGLQAWEENEVKIALRLGRPNRGDGGRQHATFMVKSGCWGRTLGLEKGLPGPCEFSSVGTVFPAAEVGRRWYGKGGRVEGSLKGWEGPSCWIRSFGLSHLLLPGGSRRESLAWPHPKFRELLNLTMTSQVKFAFVYTHAHHSASLRHPPVSTETESGSLASHPG